MWEITGAEFSKSTAHTADGISVRFPRVTRIRDDKDWTNATDLDRLKVITMVQYIVIHVYTLYIHPMQFQCQTLSALT